MMKSLKILNAWKIAANDLNISIKYPFYLTAKNGKKMKFDLLIEHFGSPNGIIIMSMFNIHGLKTINNHGYSYSALNFKSYSIYDRQLFIDTLNDWGYFGDLSNTPDWYTGAPWT
jgi:hypothetical protein